MNPGIIIRILPWREAAAEATRIRTAVFVREQGVPQELELDEWDERSEHALAYDARSTAIGTGRLLPDGHIGRMAVLRDARGAGIGAALLAALVERARDRGMTRVVLNAQTHAAAFYRRHGFTGFGDEFDDAGIPHIAMAREI